VRRQPCSTLSEDGRERYLSTAGGSGSGQDRHYYSIARHPTLSYTKYCPGVGVSMLIHFTTGRSNEIAILQASCTYCFISGPVAYRTARWLETIPIRSYPTSTIMGGAPEASAPSTSVHQVGSVRAYCISLGPDRISPSPVLEAPGPSQGLHYSLARYKLHRPYEGKECRPESISLF
jgi:hypothetical protein